MLNDLPDLEIEHRSCDCQPSKLFISPSKKEKKSFRERNRHAIPHEPLSPAESPASGTALRGWIGCWPCERCLGLSPPAGRYGPKLLGTWRPYPLQKKGRNQNLSKQIINFLKKE